MELEDAKARIGTATVLIGAGFIIGNILQYGVKALLARFLGPDTYGIYIQGLAILNFLIAVSLLGLSDSLARFMSFYKGEQNKKAVQDSMATATAVSLIGGVIMTGVMLGTSSIIASLFNEPMLQPVLDIFALALIPLTVFHLVTSMMKGVQNAKYRVYISDVLRPFSVFLLLVLFFYLGLEVRGAVYAYILGVTVAAVTGIYYFRQIGDYTLGDPVSRAKELVLFSWPVMIVTVLVIVNKWIDVLMLGWLTDSSTVGIYEVAMMVAGLSVIAVQSLKYMYMPVSSELLSQGKKEDISSLYHTVTRWSFILTLPILACFLVFSAEILTILFGSTYAAGSTVLFILTLGYSSVLAGPTEATLLSLGKPKLLMLSLLLWGGLDIILNLALIPSYGMIGAAVAMSAALIISSAVQFLFVNREIKVQPFRFLHLKLVIAIFAASVPVYLVKSTFQASLIFNVVLGGVLFSSYTAFLLLMDAYRESDVRIARKTIDQTRSWLSWSSVDA